jgi:hypothetical protein
VHHFEPEADDPLHEPAEGGLIGKFGAEGRGARAPVISQSSNSERRVVSA